MAFLMVLSSVSSYAQISIADGNAVTENFDSMGATGTNLPQNWKMSTAGAGTSAGWSTGANVTSVTQTPSSGSPNSGARYSFGNGANTDDRAIGFMTSGSFSSPNAIFAYYKNTSGLTIADITIDFDFERYRINSNTVSVAFFTSTNGTTWTQRTNGAIATSVFATGSNSYTWTNGTVASRSVVVNDVNIANDGSLYLKWVVTNTSSSNSQGIGLDNVSVTATLAPTWNGTAWANGITPTASTDTFIDGNYAAGTFTAQSLTVNANNTLTINAGETITTGNTTNNGNIIVNDGGNFIQTVGSTYTAGIGSSFVTNRNSASAANKYVFWSSPVVDQNIFTAYSSGSSTLAPTYVMTYNTTSNFYDLVTNTDSNFVANSGKGYSVKVPQANAGVLFGGTNKTPNNGIVNVSLAGTPGGLNNFNLIGNPYPSNLDLTAFYNANTAGIESTLWFWDNTTGNVTTQTGSTATNVGYATINAASGTWTEAPGTQSYNSATLNGLGSIAKIGQGFIVRALDAGQISFTNAMRASAAGVTLNKNVDANAGKFWIKLTTSYGNTVTQAVTYGQNASNAYDIYDSKAMGVGSDAFYSLAGAEKVIIQGRAPFSINDVVPLGAKHFENGNFTVSLSHKEGVFTNGQAIYLHDKSTGTYTNLQTQAYSFTANAGEFTDRFEIVYKLNVLATAELEKDAFEIYRDGEDFFVRNNKNIENIEVFDAAGRKVQNFDSKSKLVRIKLGLKGWYIIKAKSAGKEYSKKVVN